MATHRPTVNGSLTPELDAFLQGRLKSGRYQTTSEVVREAPASKKHAQPPENRLWSTCCGEAQSRSIVMAHPQREKDGKISRAMNDTDYLNRRHFPDVHDDTGVEIPEAIPSVEQFIMAGRNSETGSPGRSIKITAPAAASRTNSEVRMWRSRMEAVPVGSGVAEDR